MRHQSQFQRRLVIVAQATKTMPSFAFLVLGPLAMLPAPHGAIASLIGVLSVPVSIALWVYRRGLLSAVESGKLGVSDLDENSSSQLRYIQAHPLRLLAPLFAPLFFVIVVGVLATSVAVYARPQFEVSSVR